VRLRNAIYLVLKVQKPAEVAIEIGAARQRSKAAVDNCCLPDAGDVPVAS